jgi:predicted nuclease of predicted toxin-antitoxin system
MWLLDVNLPNGLLQVLRGFGIACDTTVQQGWRALTNGELAAAAFGAGFRVILTRDRDFGTTASRVLSQLPELAIVVVTIPQAREAVYLESFEAQWRERPIVPVPGSAVEWP